MYLYLCSMKQINMLKLLAVLFVFSSCTSSLEKKALKRCTIVPTEAIGYKCASLNFSDKKVLFSDDSICVVQYTVNTENYSGDKESMRIEYFILKTRGTDEKPSKLLEATYVLDGKTASLLDNEASHYEFIKKYSNKQWPSSDSERSSFLRTLAVITNSKHLQVVDE